MLPAEVPVGIWLGETVGLGLVLSDGCCCAGLQVAESGASSCHTLGQCLTQYGLGLTHRVSYLLKQD